MNTMKLKQIFAFLILIPALCWAQTPTPLYLGQHARISYNAGETKTFRVYYNDSMAGHTPYLHVWTNRPALSFYTSSVSVVSASTGIVDFTFSGFTNSGNFFWDAGISDTKYSYDTGNFDSFLNPSTGQGTNIPPSPIVPFDCALYVFQDAGSAPWLYIVTNGVQVGDILTWNGTNWVPSSAGAGDMLASMYDPTAQNRGVVFTNDARLMDARTPLAHNQAWSTITNTPITLAGYGITDAILAGTKINAATNADAVIGAQSNTLAVISTNYTPLSASLANSNLAQLAYNTSTNAQTNAANAQATANNATTNWQASFALSLTNNIFTNNVVQWPEYVGYSAMAAALSNQVDGDVFYFSGNQTLPGGTILGAMAQTSGISIFGIGPAALTITGASSLLYVRPDGQCSFNNLSFVGSISLPIATPVVININNCTFSTNSAGGAPYNFLSGYGSKSQDVINVRGSTINGRPQYGYTVNSSGSVIANTNFWASINLPILEGVAITNLQALEANDAANIATANNGLVSLSNSVYTNIFYPAVIAYNTNVTISLTNNWWTYNATNATTINGVTNLPIGSVYNIRIDGVYSSTVTLANCNISSNPAVSIPTGTIYTLFFDLNGLTNVPTVYGKQ